MIHAFTSPLCVCTRNGQIEVTISTPGDSPSVNLTTEGTADWVHWGYVDATTVTRKDNVTAQIGALTAYNGGTITRGEGLASSRYTYTWSDGTPYTSRSTKTFVRVSEPDEGLQLTASADKEAQTLVAYLNGYNSGALLEVSLSDGSAPDVSETVSLVSSGYERRVSINYRAASAGQTLTVRWTMNAGTGEVSIGAATLAQA